jgi:hypothetical protein
MERALFRNTDQKTHRPNIQMWNLKTALEQSSFPLFCDFRGQIALGLPQISGF